MKELKIIQIIISILLIIAILLQSRGTALGGAFGGGNTVTERNAGLGAAIGVLLSVCVVIVFTICNKVIKDDDLEF